MIGIDKAFLAYKQEASMNRALLKYNIKEKTLTTAEQQILNVVNQEKQLAKDEKLKKLRRR